METFTPLLEKRKELTTSQTPLQILRLPVCPITYSLIVGLEDVSLA